MDEPEKETIIDSNQRQSVATVGERSEHTGRESREEGWHRPLKSVQPSWERRELNIFRASISTGMLRIKRLCVDTERI